MRPGPAGTFQSFAEGLGVPIGEFEIARVGAWVDLLVAWNRRAPLTGDRDPALLWEKHCADSITIAPLIRAGARVVDVGSGAGLPGMVLACCLPNSLFTLVESRRKASSFLSHAAAQIGLLNVEVVSERVAMAAAAAQLAGAADMVVSRAVAASVLLTPARELLRTGGTLVLMEAGSTSNTLALPPGLEAHGERSYRLPTGERRRLRLIRAV